MRSGLDNVRLRINFMSFQRAERFRLRLAHTYNLPCTT